MTNEELIAQVDKLQRKYFELTKACADAGAEVALLVYMIEEESDDD
jgi:hypothetical protein